MLYSTLPFQQLQASLKRHPYAEIALHILKEKKNTTGTLEWAFSPPVTTTPYHEWIEQYIDCKKYLISQTLQIAHYQVECFERQSSECTSYRQWPPPNFFKSQEISWQKDVDKVVVV